MYCLFDPHFQVMYQATFHNQKLS